MDTLQETFKTAGKLLHVQPQINPENQMAGQNQEPGDLKQRRGHDPQSTDLLDRTFQIDG